MFREMDAATATEQLFSLYKNDVYRYARFTLGDSDAADDIVQEVFIKVLKSWDRFRGDANPKTWLWSIVKNCIVDYSRKHKHDKTHQPLDEYLGGTSHLETDMLFEAEELLESLSRVQREVVVLRLIQDLSSAETAQILKCSESKVRTTLHRAVVKLRTEGGKKHG